MRISRAKCRVAKCPWARAASVGLWLLGWSGAAVNPVQSQAKPEITVSAAASLREMLAELNRGYGRATIRLNLGASGTLQRQIEQGAPVDVFVAAASKNMNELAAAGLVDSGTRLNLAANRLVLIEPLQPRAGVARLRSFRDLGRNDVTRLVLGNPGSVPAGAYAKEVLEKLGLYNKMALKMVFARDVRDALTQVEMGNVDAGIVYRTDALASRGVRIVAVAPAGLHSPIVYPAAVVSASRNKAEARAYLKFLGSPQARQVFGRHGFDVAAPQGRTRQ